jgi:NuA3 HAT complex component NTO1
MASIGYQQTARFSRPPTLIRDRPDPGIDEELNSIEVVDRVEYDMDEQDNKWLTAQNSYRKLLLADPITREVFEITMTKIEKEWVTLEKKIPKVIAKPHSAGYGNRRRSSGRLGDDDGEEEGGEDSKCAICDDGECENSNAIVFCDGCNLAVHQDCYGVPYIPEGQWLCRKCLTIPNKVAVSSVPLSFSSEAS